MPAGRSGLARPSPLGLFLLAALFLGFGAAFLAGTSPPAPSVPGGSGYFVTYSSLVIFGFVIVGAVAAWIVYRLVARLRNPSGAEYLSRAAVGFVVAFLLCLGFIVIAHFLGPSNGATSALPFNTTTPPAQPPASNGSGLPPGSPPLSYSVPHWDVYAGVLIVAVVVALVVAPLVAARVRRPDGANPDESVAAAQRARTEVAQTLRRLEQDPNADPRALIVALYAKLLSNVTPHLPTVDALTAREVERAAVARLGLPAAAARDLTVLFEEARYSAHPMGPAETARAREALARILDELAPGRP